MLPRHMKNTHLINKGKSVVAIMVAGVSLVSAEEENVDKLEPAVIVAEKVEDSINTITADKINKTSANSLGDIFKSNPQVAVGGGGLPIAQKVYVRGINDFLLNVTIDGATQAGEVYHHQSRVYIDPFLLKQVQVEAGAGVATNGPGALGGAIRYETKDPSDLLRAGQDFGFSLKNGYYSNTQGWKSSLSIYGRVNNKLDYLFSLSKSQFGDFKDGNGDTTDYSSSNRQLGYFKLGYQANDAHRFELSYERSEEEGYRYNRPNLLAAFGHPVQPNTLHNQETIRDTVTYNHMFNPADNDLIDAKMTAYYTRNDFQRDVPISEPTYGNAGIKTLGLDVRNTSIIGNHSLTYGMDLRYDKAYVKQVNAGRFGVQPDGDENALVAGIYIQDNWRINDQWLFSIGARLDHYDHEDADGDKTDDLAFSPNIGIKHFATDELTLYANAARVERGLGVSEAYFSTWSDDATGLEKETANNYEVGFKYDNGTFSFGGEFFYQDIRDVISYGFVEPLGDIKTVGYSAHVGYRRENFTATLAVTEADPELNGETVIYNPYGSASGRTWVLDLAYNVPDCHLSFGWRTRLVEGLGTVKDTRGDAYKLRTYATSDVYLQWMPTGNDDWTVNVSVNNLFDRYYKDHITLYNDWEGSQPDPGRDVRIDLTYRF